MEQRYSVLFETNGWTMESGMRLLIVGSNPTLRRGRVRVTVDLSQGDPLDDLLTEALYKELDFDKQRFTIVPISWVPV